EAGGARADAGRDGGGIHEKRQCEAWGRAGGNRHAREAGDGRRALYQIAGYEHESGVGDGETERKYKHSGEIVLRPEAIRQPDEFDGGYETADRRFPEESEEILAY